MERPDADAPAGGDGGVVDVSVLIPTVGRAELLEQCLRSLERCRPRAREILVVDQSDGDEVAAVVPRSGARALGGFDERFPNASDNDFGYRWLVSGRAMRFDPRLVVWHHDWRTPAQVRRLYWKYGRWQGAFYVKHLLQGDRRVL